MKALSYTRHHILLAQSKLLKRFQIPTCKVCAGVMPSIRHWNVKDIQSEISSMEMLLQARPNLASGKLKSMLIEKICHLQMESPSEMIALYETVENSKLPTSFKEEVVALLDQKAIDHQEDQSTVKLTTVPQECLGLNNYFTEKEHEALLACDAWKGASIIANRLKLLGFTSIKEKTKKVGVALLCWYERERCGKLPSAQTAYSLSEHLLSTFQHCTTQSPEGTKPLAHWPKSPQSLNPVHLRASYGDEMPVERSYPDLALILKKDAPVRGTDKRLRQEKQQVQAKTMNQADTATQGCMVVPSQPVAANVPTPLALQGLLQPDATAQNNVLASMMASTMWNNLLEQSKALLSNNNMGGINLTINKGTSTDSMPSPASSTTRPETVAALAPLTSGTAPSTSPAQSVALPLADKVEPTEPSLQGQSENQNDVKSKSLEDYEKEAFDKLAAKRNGKMKRPAASCPAVKASTKAVAKPKTSAVPKGKAQQTLKLGCKKCRGAVGGCHQCRNGNYKGLRLNREEWKALASKTGLK